MSHKEVFTRVPKPQVASQNADPRRPRTGRRGGALGASAVVLGIALAFGAVPAQAKINPKITMEVTPVGSSIYGTPLTVDVIITGQSNTDPAPTGTLTIMNREPDNTNNYMLCSTSIDTNAALQTCTTPNGLYLPVRDYHFIVGYSGDANYNGDATGAFASQNYTVGKGSIAFTVTPGPTLFVGQYAVFNYLRSSLGIPKGGTLSISIPSANGDCSVALDGVTYPPCVTDSKVRFAGVFHISLTYAGDPNLNDVSVSDAGTITILPAPTTTLVAPSPTSIALGDSTTVSVNVASSVDGTLADGSVTVSDGESSCTTVLSVSHSTCMLTPISAGAKTLTATFTGSSNFAASQGSATLTVIAPAVNGACGSDNGQVISATPVHLCSAGTASAVTGIGHPWSWSCAGSNGGTDASCSANIQTWAVTTQITGSGTANPAQQLIDVGKTGVLTLLPDAGYAIASASGCGGSLSGNVYTTAPVSIDCVVAIRFALAAQPVNGVCGSDDGQLLSTTPTHLCSAGTPSAVAGSGPWTWTCAGSNAGTTASCSAQLQTKAATTTTLQLSQNPVTIAQPVLASVTVLSNAPTRSSRSAVAATPAAVGGTAEVSGGGASCTATISNGIGNCTLAFITPGTFTISANYNGDVANAPSSDAVGEIVLAAGASDALAPAPMLGRWTLFLLGLGLSVFGGYRVRRELR